MDHSLKHNADAPPKVSIIMPTYNRAKFLDQALQSIQEQTFHDWELILVDDGSTDETPQMIDGLRARITQPLHYVRQANAGAYGARNTGLDHARGNLIAFFDSDDYWLPHHLADCVAALDANPDVDWVYGAGRIVDFATNAVLAENTFYIDGRRRPFLELQHRTAGGLKILAGVEPLRCQIQHGLYCGLQKSVFRRSVFAARRFEAARRNEAEDQLFVIHYLLEGRTLGYLDNVHLIYRVHEANSSAAAANNNAGALERKIFVIRTMIAGYEELPALFALDSPTLQQLRRRLGREYFWTLGYSVLWQNGRRREALEAFQRGLNAWPWSFACWKTYFVARCRALLSSTTSSGVSRSDA